MLLLLVIQNSDERKKPKKADVAAAHNMQRFKKDNLDVIKNWYNLRSKTGVKGYVMVFCFFVSLLLMARNSINNCGLGVFVAITP